MLCRAAVDAGFEGDGEDAGGGVVVVNVVGPAGGDVIGAGATGAGVTGAGVAGIKLELDAAVLESEAVELTCTGAGPGAPSM